MNTIDSDLRARILDRLGLPGAPSIDLDGLRALYAAWCARVPFDNVQKMIALRSAGARSLPGGTAVEFFESWLADGTGGTCWSSSNALYELVHALGFDARRVAGSMRDMGEVLTHGSTKVRIDGADWLIDSSLLTIEPIPIGDGTFIGDDPFLPAEVEIDKGQHVVWFTNPPGTDHIPCRLLSDDTTHAEYLERYEASRERSPFNARLYLRRSLPGEVVMLIGGTRFSKTLDGTTQRELTPEELCAVLRQEIGLSERIVRQWAEWGSLDSSYEPPTGPPPLPPPRVQPSRR